MIVPSVNWIIVPARLGAGFKRGLHDAAPICDGQPNRSVRNRRKDKFVQLLFQECCGKMITSGGTWRRLASRSLIPSHGDESNVKREKM